MAQKLGRSGAGMENYDPETGKYVDSEVLGAMGIDNHDEYEEYSNSDYDFDNKYKTEMMLKESYSKLIDNDNTRLHRYREWANNSDNNYKRYIYDDLKNNKRTAALNLWYNYYKTMTGQYDLSFQDFLNTPIKLYRATNVGEKEDATNPFFSYAQNKRLAERFLTTAQNSYFGRTGQIEEIEVRPRDTFGMLPSDENEIIIPNPKYEELNRRIDGWVEYASSRGVTLPYDKEDLLDMALKRGSKETDEVSNLENLIRSYVDKKATR